MDRFRILGIEPGALLDPANPTAFVTGLTFVSAGRFTGTMTPLTSSFLGEAKVWVGLKNSDAVGLRLDLKAEIYVGDTRVGEGRLDNVPAGSSGFNNARLHTIELAELAQGVVLEPSTPVSLHLSVRRTCPGAGHLSGGIRLWFDGAAIDGGAGRSPGSRVNVVLNGSAVELFLRHGFMLGGTRARIAGRSMRPWTAGSAVRTGNSSR